MNKKWDKEYSTQYTKEVEYLTSNGIKYTFVKDILGISNYKYTKNEKLFKALLEFYKNY